MQVFNKTPYRTGSFVNTIKQPNDVVAVLIKGTFTIDPGGPAQPAPNQARLCGETSYPDAPDLSCLYPSDHVPYKPKTDIMVIGDCHPDGGSAETAKVAIELGPLRKELAVFGDRIWRRSKDGTIHPSKPTPFTSMPIRYTKALGGSEYLRNPIGKGRDNVMSDDGSVHLPLPNIEDPQNLMSNMDHEPLPVGFGPLPTSSVFRIQKQGTRDSAWKNRRAPLSPIDFDWSFYNAAPEDQQLPGYLTGNETLKVSFMHPEHRHLACTLPGLRPRFFLLRSHGGRTTFIEAGLKLDTLWVNTASMEMILTWRGLVSIATPDAQDLAAGLVVQEALADPKGDTELYRAELDALMARPRPPASPAAPDPEPALTAALATIEDEDLKADLATKTKDPMAFLQTLTDKIKADIPAPPE